MSDDKELLELAAKACGVKGEYSVRRIGRTGNFGLPEFEERQGIGAWNQDRQRASTMAAAKIGKQLSA